MQGAGDWIIFWLSELWTELAMSLNEQIQRNLPEVAVFVTLELSKSAWLLAAQAIPSGKTFAHRLGGGDVSGLLALLRRLQAREQRSSGRAVAIILGYEAGYDGFWLQRRLSAEALTCFVIEQVAAAEAERDAAVATPANEDADAEKVTRLARLGGIGTELATVLVREALYRPFATRKQVAAYAGLTPSPYASGDRQRDQGISKAGNPLLRKSMIELAWLWLRYQPGSGLARWFVERVGTGRGRIRKITAVALARKLLVALWRYLATGLVPEGARLKAI
jgi:transposase